MPRPYGERDRQEQLRRCALLGDELADAYARYGHSAAGYRELADGARRLAEHGFAADDLRDLARLLPPAAAWMNPKAVDAGLPVEPWQLDAADRHAALAAVALELRATARYGDAR
jgi:hypothetical protein